MFIIKSNKEEKMLPTQSQKRNTSYNPTLPKLTVACVYRTLPLAHFDARKSDTKENRPRGDNSNISITSELNGSRDHIVVYCMF